MSLRNQTFASSGLIIDTNNRLCPVAIIRRMCTVARLTSMYLLIYEAQYLRVRTMFLCNVVTMLEMST